MHTDPTTRSHVVGNVLIGDNPPETVVRLHNGVSWTWAQLKELRKLHRHMGNKALAEHFGVDRADIRRTLYHCVWTWHIWAELDA